MKLSLTTDFTKLPRADAVRLRTEGQAGTARAGRITLAHDERHLRRRVLTADTGERVLVDLAEPVALAGGDRLLLDDGREIEIASAPEDLLEVRPRDAVHLAELAWHIGNRHLAAAIEAGRILILRDRVIEAMLHGLGAELRHVTAPFEPVRGAYGGHDAHRHAGHGHGAQGHGSHDRDGDDNGKRDAHGRQPDDPHYGHSHS